MSKIGLFIGITKSSTYFESINDYKVVDTIDEAHMELINYLVKHLGVLNIDYPLSFEDFEYIWFNEQYVKSSVFNYKLFVNDKWVEPWESQEIYSDVLDKMFDEEIKNPPDFSHIYGEPNALEEPSAVDNESSISHDTMPSVSEESTKDMEFFEKTLKNIIEQSKTVVSHDDASEKACGCDKCICKI